MNLARSIPFLLPLAAGFVIAVVAAWLLARRLVQPIGRIGAALAALSQGRLDTRIGATLDRFEPAISALAKAFDVAAANLQEPSDSRARLFHDLSHDIRSPLARLQRGGEQAIHAVALDLIDVLDPILRDVGIEGQPLGKTVRHAGPEGLALTGDAGLLHRAFENILRNALRYAPEGSAVAVTVGTGEGAVTVAVKDAGPGVDPARLDRIFEAFERDETGPGRGLGLAIAARAVRLHGGTLTARNEDGGGFTMTCRLPKAAGRHGIPSCRTIPP